MLWAGVSPRRCPHMSFSKDVFQSFSFLGRNETEEEMQPWMPCPCEPGTVQWCDLCASGLTLHWDTGSSLLLGDAPYEARTENCPEADEEDQGQQTSRGPSEIHFRSEVVPVPSDGGGTSCSDITRGGISFRTCFTERLVAGVQSNVCSLNVVTGCVEMHVVPDSENSFCEV